MSPTSTKGALKMQTKSKLTDLVTEIELDLASLKNGDAERRKLIIRIGKRLLAAQKECKSEGVAFKDWWESGLKATFTHIRTTQHYMAIARYPSAFKAEMSIREGARICRYAKTHGGELPAVEWKGGDNRRLITFQRKVGKSLTAISQMVELGPKLNTIRKEEKWTKDEMAGTLETLRTALKEIQAAIKLLEA